MVEELLTSRPPLLLSCCLEDNPDNMKCDAWILLLLLLDKTPHTKAQKLNHLELKEYRENIQKNNLS